MKKINILLLVISLALALSACPRPLDPNGPPAPDPYATARAVIQGAELAVLGADGIFEIAMAFTDPTRVPELRKAYLKIRASVLDGLRLALDGVAIAESQKQGFDLAKLMAQAETAYQDLLKFIAGLKATPSSMPKAGPPELPPLPPTLLPAAKK